MINFKELYNVDYNTMKVILEPLKSVERYKYCGNYSKWELDGIDKDIDYVSYSFKNDDYYTFDIDVYEKDLKVRIYVSIRYDGEYMYSADKIALEVKNYFFKPFKL